MVKLARTALVLVALAVPAGCGDDDDDGTAKTDTEATTTTEALFTAQELAPDIEKDILERARREERAAGNNPNVYNYKSVCVVKSETQLACRLDLTNTEGKTVNTVAYAADVDPDTGEFGYEVTANRDTRK